MAYYPFLLSPAAKDYIWGGNKINEIFGKNIDIYPLAETWECSVHPDGPSTVRSGEFAGMPLTELFGQHPDIWSASGEPAEKFPLLIKFIDAKKSLSVQVHPDDAYAQRVEGQEHGKTECWYVIDAEPGAKLVYGFSREVSPAEVAAAAKDESIETILRHVPVFPGDLIPIPAGTVHAIGAGILLAEIQQNSNLTYRLYDWGRMGADGRPRQLHVEKAADVMLTDASPVDFRTPAKGSDGVPEVLLENSLFTLSRLVCTNNSGILEHSPDSFAVFLCVSGFGTLCGISFRAGDCIFIPRTFGNAGFSGDFTALISK